MSLNLPKTIRVSLRGQRWRVRFVRRLPGKMGKTHDGVCDRDNRTIWVAIGPEAVETLIHECLHACLWDLDEDAITETGRDMAKVLARVAEWAGKR